MCGTTEVEPQPGVWTIRTQTRPADFEPGDEPEPGAGAEPEPAGEPEPGADPEPEHDHNNADINYNIVFNSIICQNAQDMFSSDVCM